MIAGQVDVSTLLGNLLTSGAGALGGAQFCIKDDEFCIKKDEFCIKNA